MKKLLTALIFFLILNTSQISYSVTTLPQSDETSDGQNMVLSNGYKEIRLGMTLEEVRQIINSMPEFNPIREEILQIRIEPDKQILTTEGYSFVSKAYFHFDNDRLYQILLKFNQNKIGYFNLLSTFRSRFGEPAFINPSKSYWQNERVRITIEKPATIKYLDRQIWNSIIGSGNQEDSDFIILRNDLLNNL